MKFDDLPADQRAALIKYASDNGRYWKSKLRENRRQGEMPAPLRRFMNTHADKLRHLLLPKYIEPSAAPAAESRADA